MSTLVAETMVAPYTEMNIAKIVKIKFDSCKARSVFVQLLSLDEAHT